MGGGYIRKVYCQHQITYLESCLRALHHKSLRRKFVAKVKNQDGKEKA
jgi:hypothetical protein